MKILAIDTTAKTASCAVCEADGTALKLLCDVRLNGTLTHSESILPMIDFCLKGVDLKINDVDVLAVSTGPGSFTGVRIGVSTIKGLAFAMENVKCVPVSSLEALCTNGDDMPKGTVLCGCMDARRGQLYNALFKCDGKGNIKRLCEDRAIDAKELYGELCEKCQKSKIVLVGDGAQIAYDIFSRFEDFDNMKISVIRNDRMLQDAASVARCAYRNLATALAASELLPVYLRLSQAERERNERMNDSAEKL